ncbi:hypothetical protein [Verrucomicrobium sp. BvORR106]|uniref:hypothetical protein n=1 Tax=Verrucomicrobium sp. BvORR106 TaxID=1403819 RepID=UPI00056F00DD|nr:hypothetical protein [Verrucomicrobium sp. BvORR106]
MADLVIGSLPMNSPGIDRGAFRASAIKSFLLLVAPFEVASAGLVLADSEAYSWWTVLLPNVVSLMVGLAMVLALPRSVIGWLAANFGMACLMGVFVMALSACSYFVALDLLSWWPSSLRYSMKFTGVICLFSMPFGALYGVFLYGAAQASASERK